VGFLDQLRKKRRLPAELDAISLKQLRSRKADLSRPRHILHFLYFAEEPAARSAADTLSAGGYDTTVGPPDETIDEWFVRAETTRVVDETTVPAYRRWFEHVAAEHGGEYDGWEAATKP
jgi:hypothetical protein